VLCALGLLLACASARPQRAPELAGVVVGAQSGRPLVGALVVLREPAKSGIPPRASFRHHEERTGAGGRFTVAASVRWSWRSGSSAGERGEVFSVFAPGYRCSLPLPLSPDRVVRIELQAASDPSEQRDSCPPPPAPAAVLPRYAAAVALLERSATHTAELRRRQADGHPADPLAALLSLGYGANCPGPILDFALHPEGRRLAFQEHTSRGVAIRVAFLDKATQAPMLIGYASEHPPRRLQWSANGALTLFREPGSLAWRISPRERAEKIWRPASGSKPSEPGPRDLPALASEENRTPSSQRRSLTVRRYLDPHTRLPTQWLTVTREDGGRVRLQLPGEPCARGGRSGSPTQGLAAHGNSAFDLRWVNGGCHLVRIDLGTGAWSPLDRAGSTGLCRESRRMASSELRRALPDYARRLEALLADPQIDPRAGYMLWIEPGRPGRVEAQDRLGGRRWLEAPRLPVRTPLRRIHLVPVAPLPRADASTSPRSPAGSASPRPRSQAPPGPGA
jgi:hypothetical protein